MNIKKQLRQLVILLRNTISVRRLLMNRLTITILAIVLTFVLIQGYVSANGEGMITGTVVNSQGNPVENVSVKLKRIDLRVTRSIETMTTDENGQFQFQNSKIIEFYIVVNDDQFSQERKRFHRYYPSQNINVKIRVERLTNTTNNSP